MLKLSTVFVVTRDGRRTEDVNYATRDAAHHRARKLREALGKIMPKDYGRVEVKEVSKPNKIW
jgi:hypothetical protein